jgi:Zinc-binding loop region of homing endonuclease
MSSSQSTKRSRTRLDYDKLIGQERAIAIIATARTQVPNQRSNACWIFQGSLNTDGYGQKWLYPNGSGTGRRSQKAFLLHKLALVAKGEICHGRQTYQASHLCGRRACFNPDHICYESAEANNQRKGCPGDIRCSCDAIAYECPHIPKCLKM